MTDGQSIGWEALEIFCILIRELVMIGVHGVLLESDTECVQNCIVVLELDLVRLLREAECFLHIYLVLFCHLVKQTYSYNLQLRGS